jgi:2,5-diketo-D-gluconate reductase A
LHGYDSALQACSDSLALLGLDRIDIVLLHSPSPSGAYVQAWRALIELKRSGTIRSVGVSNFSAKQMADLIADSGVVPAVHQLEMHPHHVPTDLRAENARLGIVTQSWNPLASGSRPIPDGPVAAAAEAHGVTPDQVVLRWQLQLTVVPLPMSKDRSKQVANLDLFGFELSAAEMTEISSLAEAYEQPVGGDEAVGLGM